MNISVSQTKCLLGSRVDRMHQIWNLKIAKIWYLDNIQEIEPLLQIIVLDNKLPIDMLSNDNGFAVDVIDRFDISICKCMIPNLL